MREHRIGGNQFGAFTIRLGNKHAVKDPCGRQAGLRRAAPRRLPARCLGADDGRQAVIRILMAEDQGMVRGALATLLGLEPDFEVVAQRDRSSSSLGEPTIVLVWYFRRKGTVKARLAPAEKPESAMRLMSRPKSSALLER